MKRFIALCICLATFSPILVAQQSPKHEIKPKQLERIKERLQQAKTQIDVRTTRDLQSSMVLLHTPKPLEGGETVRKAMKDELDRNMKRLKLDDLNPPFFIGYEIRDIERTQITASLGSLLLSAGNRSRDNFTDVMVGDYQRNSENFMDMESGFGGMFGSFSIGSEVPVEDDYYGIRRALWLITDNTYRKSADRYEKKLAAIEQQNLLEELASLPDLSKEKATQMHVPQEKFEIDKKEWEKFAKDVSEVFLAFPEIQTSRVGLSFVKGIIYYVNSEGTDISYPATLASIQVSASTQAMDGEIVNEQTAFYGKTPNQLPDKQTVTEATKKLAKTLVQLKSAEIFDDTYTGPVLFEGQAVGELLSQRLFMDKDGLIATRDPISSAPGAMAFLGGKTSLENRIGKRVLPKEFSISAKPVTETYDGIPLIGSYKIDREGVVPPDKLTLIEKGKLVTLLNDRVPSKKVQQSNGHKRLGTTFEAGTAPSVIHITSSESMSNEELKKELIEAANDEGLEYAIIVRKIASPTLGFEEDINPEDIFSMQMSGGKTEGKILAPILVYKVDLESGKETLVRSAAFGGIPVSSLRNILASENKEYVYNTLTNPSSGGRIGLLMRFVANSTGLNGGFPSSFIVPNSVIFEELELKKTDRISTPKLPIVPSPLSNN